MFAKILKGAPFGNDNAAKDHVKGASGKFSGVIRDLVVSLTAERQTWIDKDYKDNRKTIQFEGDGPGKGYRSIGGINKGRRDRAIADITTSIKSLEVIDKIPERELLGKLHAAKRIADATPLGSMRNAKGVRIEDTHEAIFEREIHRALINPREAASSPVTKALREAYTAHQANKPTQAKPDTPKAPTDAENMDWLKSLFASGGN